MFNRCFILSIFFNIFFNISSFSQYLDYSQYYSSPLSLNPALTGVGEYGRFGIIYRNQWPSIYRGFQTFSTWSDYNFDNSNNNLGIIVSRQREGYAGLNSNLIGINFANEILLNSNLVIRGGLQFSYTNKNISFNNLVFGDQLNEAGIINDISKALPASGCLTAPPKFIQLKWWAVFRTISFAIVPIPLCNLISSQRNRIFFL